MGAGDPPHPPRLPPQQDDNTCVNARFLSWSRWRHKRYFEARSQITDLTPMHCIHLPAPPPRLAGPHTYVPGIVKTARQSPS